MVGALLFNWARRVLWTAEWSSIASLPAPVFNREASPFLWHLLGLLATREQPATIAERRLTLALTADSLLRHLPAESELDMPAGEPVTISLPYCAQVLNMGHGPSRLRYAAGSQLAIVSGDATLRQDTEAVRAVDHASSCPRAFTVAASCDALFVDPSSGSQIVRRATPEMLGEFGAKLGRSLGLIHAADPELHRRISDDVRYYALIEGEEREHRSFSLSTLKGVVFLSDSPWVTVLAEAIVHEHAHGELYTLAELDPLVRVDVQRLFYSPWRKDPRPLIGLFHALYVFENVACFLDRLASRFKNADIDIPARLSLLDLQAAIALAQIDPADLTPSGVGILEMITQSMRQRRVAEHLVGPERAGMSRVHDHSRAWSANRVEAPAVNVECLLSRARGLLDRSGRSGRD